MTYPIGGRAEDWETITAKTGTTTLLRGEVHATDCEGCSVGSRPCAFHKPRGIKDERKRIIDLAMAAFPNDDGADVGVPK